MQSGWWKGFLRNLWVRQKCEQSWWSGSSCCLATPLATWSACCPLVTDIQQDVSIKTHEKHTQPVKRRRWQNRSIFIQICNKELPMDDKISWYFWNQTQKYLPFISDRRTVSHVVITVCIYEKCNINKLWQTKHFLQVGENVVHFICDTW